MPGRCCIPELSEGCTSSAGRVGSVSDFAHFPPPCAVGGALEGALEVTFSAVVLLHSPYYYRKRCKETWISLKMHTFSYSHPWIKYVTQLAWVYVRVRAHGFALFPLDARLSSLGCQRGMSDLL